MRHTTIQNMTIHNAFQTQHMTSFNDIALHDCEIRRIGRPYRDAQDRLLWKDKTCLART